MSLQDVGYASDVSFTPMNSLHFSYFKSYKCANGMFAYRRFSWKMEMFIVEMFIEDVHLILLYYRLILYHTGINDDLTIDCAQFDNRKKLLALKMSMISQLIKPISFSFEYSIFYNNLHVPDRNSEISTAFFRFPRKKWN